MSEAARLSRPRGRRCEFPDQGGDCSTKKQFFANVVVATRLSTFATRVETAQLSRSMRRLSDFPDQGEDGKTFETKEETARLSRPSRRRRDSEKKAIAFFQSEVETKRLRKQRDSKYKSVTGLFKSFATRWRWRSFCIQGGNGHGRFGTFTTTKAETAQVCRPRRRRCDFPDRGGDGTNQKHFFATVGEAT